MKLAFYKQLKKICDMGQNPEYFRLYVDGCSLYAFNQYIAVSIELFEEYRKEVHVFDYEALMDIYAPMKPSYDLIDPYDYVVEYPEDSPLRQPQHNFMERIIGSNIDAGSEHGSNMYDTKYLQMVLDTFKKANADFTIQTKGGMNVFTGFAEDYAGRYPMMAIIMPMRK